VDVAGKLGVKSAAADFLTQSERVGQNEVLDKLDKKKTLRGIFNPVVLTTSFIFLLDNITVQGLAFFAPTIVKTIYPQDSVVSQQLHTVPPYVVGAFFTVLLPFLSWRFDKRMIFFILGAPLMMIGYIMFLASTDGQTRYGATFLIASGAFSFGALCNAQGSANVVSDTARASAIGKSYSSRIVIKEESDGLSRYCGDVRQRRRSDLDVEFPSHRCSQLPHR
jgi:Na+/melibiose symporter-like transporter